MNPSTAQAEVLVDELIRNGAEHVVLAPGSRNAPLSFALHRAEQAGRLRLHVRVDERSGGFLALGLAARTAAPVAVVCTSGTAATNLHPAVAEADQAGVPLLVLTADRPPELRAAGANQAIDQHRLFGSAVRMFDELAVAERSTGQNAYWRSQVCRAHAAALGPGRAGPVQLNLPFREPLVPDDEQDWCEPLTGRADGGPWTDVRTTATAPGVLTRVTASRGVVLVAESDLCGEADELGRRLGWPVLAETGGVGAGGDGALTTGTWLLDLPEFLAEHRPEQVVCFGRPTVFRQVQQLLSQAGVEVLLVRPGGDWPAPAHNVRQVADAAGRPEQDAVDTEWLTAWQQADQKAAAALHHALDLERWPSGVAVARDVVDALPPAALLVLGSSNPTRDVALAARQRPDVAVHRNRGVAGIDGTVSTAAGAALAHEGPAYALLGDLTFLHDSNGLLSGSGEVPPDLTVVVVNDDGGGIFALLEQARPEHAAAFERVFGTPHGTDLGALCAAHGVEHVAAAQRSELAAALEPRPGLRVVEVRTERAGLAGVHERLRAAVRSAVLG